MSLKEKLIFDNNSLYLFYLTSFRDYKKYWFKTVLSLVGLVLSISLVTTVAVYIDTIEYYLDKKDLISQVYPQSYVSHQRGSIKNEEIPPLIQKTSISHGYPYKNISREIEINGSREFCNIVGIDLIYMGSFLAQNSRPAEKDAIFLVSNNENISREKIAKITINSKSYQVVSVYNSDQPIPLVVMDISTLGSIFGFIQIDRLYVEDYQAKNFDSNELPEFKIISSSTGKQRISEAFFINLKFIGLLSTVISTLLIYLFFRFIQKHRLLTDHLLINLGISSEIKRTIRIIESIFFIVITTSLGFGLGIVLSQFGLEILSKTMNTLYYSISIQNIVVRPPTFVKSLLVSVVSVSFALSPMVQKIESSFLKLRPVAKWIMCLIFISCGIFLIFGGQEDQWIGYRSMIGLIIIVFCMSLTVVSGLSYIFANQKSDRMMMIKTASFYIQKEVVLSTMMVVAIALACGLFISMSIFINSFQNAVSEWIIKSTQSDVYIQSKNNSIPSPVPMTETDITKLINHPATISWESISRDNIVVNEKEIMLRGIPYQHITEQIQFIEKIRDGQEYVFSENDILISESAAQKLGVKVGQTLKIPTPKETFRGQVAGIYIDYASEHGVITISKKIMKRLYQDQFQIHGITLMIDETQKSSLLSSFSHLLIQTKAELQNYVIRMFKQTFGLTWILASISGIIALFVLVNMLSVMTIDRRSEIMQIFSIGGQRLHLRQLIFSHALWIGLVSLIMSTVVGFSLALIILKQLTPTYFGWKIPLLISIPPILYLMVSMFLVIIVTSYLAYRYIWKKVTENIYIHESIKTHYFSR